MTKPAYISDEEHAPPSPAMTPTQAQIEAAAIALYRAHCIRGDRRFDWEQSVQSMWHDYAKAALTAAAEAKPNPLDLEHEWFSKGWNDAIERCAQVAEQYATWAVGNERIISAEAKQIAAAIRAFRRRPIPCGYSRYPADSFMPANDHVKTIRPLAIARHFLKG